MAQTKAARAKSQAKYNSKPLQKKRRAQRNAARRKMERAGKVHKGDGKDVDHKNHNTGDNRMSNLQVQDKGTNRKDGNPSAKMRGALLNPRKKKKRASK